MVMDEVTACDAPHCNRNYGHEGSHGAEVAPGLIFAPWSDLPRQRFDDGDPIPCNSCGQLLVLHPERCRATCVCGQMITIDGRGWTETKTSLYPATMTDPKMLREYGTYKVAQWRFADTLQHRFGLIDDVERDRREVKSKTALDEFIAREVAPLERRRWWQFWRLP